MDASNEIDHLVFFEHARSTAEANYKKNPLDAENLTRWGGALLELAQFQSGPDSNKYLQDAIGKLEEALEIEPRRADTLWCLGNAHTSYGFLSTDQDAAGGHFSKATQCFEQAVEEAPSNNLYRKSLDVSHKGRFCLALHQDDVPPRFAMAGLIQRYLFDANQDYPNQGRYWLLEYLLDVVGFYHGLRAAWYFNSDVDYMAPELHMEIQRQMESQSASVKRSSSAKDKISKKKNNADLKYDILGWMILAVGVIAWVGMAKSPVPPPPPR